MIKILYAFNKNRNAKIQLYRFNNAIKDLNYNIRYAAFKNYSPPINIDYTIDCLYSFNRPNIKLKTNDNLENYYKEIKAFNPDLIISDMEYFTSYVANLLNITLMQCSSSLISEALPHKYKYGLGLYTDYGHLYESEYNHKGDKINILENSNIKLVYSHFGDTINAPPLLNEYQWIRPYHKIANNNILARHSYVSPTSNKYIINLLKYKEDSVLFNDNNFEIYKNIESKDIYNDEEYYSNLKNCQYYICEGQTSFLADAYYNGVYSYSIIDSQDKESAYNSYISRSLGLGECVTSLPSNNKNIINNLNNVKYLHELIEEIF